MKFFRALQKRPPLLLLGVLIMVIRIVYLVNPLFVIHQQKHIKQPAPQIQTQPNETALMSRGGSFVERQPQELEYVVTAYTAGPESTGKGPGNPGYGITASGTQATEGRTCACPPELPFGTQLYIEGLGSRVCEDRGGGIQVNRLDVYMDSLKAALAWGRQTVGVMVEQ